MTEYYIKAMLGEHAVHVPAWMYVQDSGDGIVSFVGASRVAAPHPLRFGSERTHQFMVGEIVARPHEVIATDALKGTGLAGLVGGHDIERMLAEGERILPR